jgi:hypothetical protein
VSRGNALIEALVIGALIAIAVAQTAVAAGRIHAAGDRATEAAQIAAAWTARHGDESDARRAARTLAPEAETVDVVRSDTEITVIVRIRVGLLGRGGPRHTVVGRATVRLSDYRSNHG